MSLNVGFPKIFEIAPGNEVVSAVEVSRPNSIICIMFQTVAYNIMFGFYKADDESSFETVNEGDEENEYINHPLS